MRIQTAVEKGTWRGLAIVAGVAFSVAVLTAIEFLQPTIRYQADWVPLFLFGTLLISICGGCVALVGAAKAAVAEVILLRRPDAD